MHRISVFDNPLPINSLSFGGGKQSSTMVAKVLEGELPKPDVVIFANPMWERDGTYENLLYWRPLIEDAGIPFVEVSKGDIRADMIDEVRSEKTSILMPMFVNGSRWEDIPGKRKLLIRDVKHTHRKAEKAAKAEGLLFEMPSLDVFMEVALKKFDEDVRIGKIVPGFVELKTSKLARKCTVEYKIKPIQSYMKAQFGISKDKPAGSWIGISLDEWTRMRTDPPDAEFRKIYPLIDLRMTTEDCIKFLTATGHPIPIKSACIGCPFHDNDGWKDLTDAELTDVSELERLLNELIQASDNLKNRPYFANGVHFHRSKEDIGSRPYEGKEAEVEIQDEACTEAGCFL